MHVPSCLRQLGGGTHAQPPASWGRCRHTATRLPAQPAAPPPARAAPPASLCAPPAPTQAPLSALAVDKRLQHAAHTVQHTVPLAWSASRFPEHRPQRPATASFARAIVLTAVAGGAACSIHEIRITGTGARPCASATTLAARALAASSEGKAALRAVSSLPTRSCASLASSSALRRRASASCVLSCFWSLRSCAARRCRCETLGQHDARARQLVCGAPSRQPRWGSSRRSLRCLHTAGPRQTSCGGVDNDAGLQLPRANLVLVQQAVVHQRLQHLPHRLHDDAFLGGQLLHVLGGPHALNTDILRYSSGMHTRVAGQP